MTALRTSMKIGSRKRSGLTSIEGYSYLMLLHHDFAQSPVTTDMPKKCTKLKKYYF